MNSQTFTVTIVLSAEGNSSDIGHKIQSLIEDNTNFFIESLHVIPEEYPVTSRDGYIE